MNIFGNLIGLLTGGGLKKGLPDILGLLLGGGSIKDKILNLARGKADAQEARSAGKELGFATHKIISGVAQHTPAAQREAATRQMAQALATQYAVCAREALEFGELALVREAARGNAATEPAALATREKGEEEMIKATLDLGRLCAGQTLTQ